jgi:hypothetical protein
MFVFIVPLRSPESCSNWLEVSALCNSTLSSLTQQTSSNYQVVLVCNSLPVDFIANDRIIVVRDNFPIPYSLEERNTDIYNKVKRGMVEVRKLELVKQDTSVFIMKVDADDLVSNRLVSFTERHPDRDGWYFATGYIYEVESNNLFFRPRFNTVSGTSHILKCNYSDFPESMDTPAAKWLDLIWQHLRVNKLLEPKGRILKPLLFPGAVYRINSQNFSAPDLEDKRYSSLKAIVWKVLCKQKLTSKIINEFGFSDSNRS